MFMFDDVQQPVQDLRQGAAGFTRLHHAAIKRRKHPRMPAEGVIQAGPLLDIIGHIDDDPFKDRIFRLIFHHFKQPDNRYPCPHHGSELFGKKDQFRGLDRCQAFLDSCP